MVIVKNAASATRNIVGLHQASQVEGAIETSVLARTSIIIGINRTIATIDQKRDINQDSAIQGFFQIMSEANIGEMRIKNWRSVKTQLTYCYQRSLGWKL